MYEDCTASYLTESLKNVFYRDAGKSGDKYQSINSLMFEYELETNQIKRVELAAVPEGTGLNGTEIEFAFKERYYEKNDIFKMDRDGVQFFVTSGPIRKSDDFWVLCARIVSDTYNSEIDPTDYAAGDTTRFIGNAFKNFNEFIKFLVDALLGD